MKRFLSLLLVTAAVIAAFVLLGWCFGALGIYAALAAVAFLGAVFLGLVLTVDLNIAACGRRLHRLQFDKICRCASRLDRWCRFREERELLSLYRAAAELLLARPLSGALLEPVAASTRKSRQLAYEVLLLSDFACRDEAALARDFASYAEAAREMPQFLIAEYELGLYLLRLYLGRPDLARADQVQPAVERLEASGSALLKDLGLLYRQLSQLAAKRKAEAFKPQLTPLFACFLQQALASSRLDR